MKKYYYFILLFVDMLLCNTTIIRAQNYVQDSLILVNLYDSTDGAHWKHNTNWLKPGVPVDRWYGITGNNYHRVTAILLNNNNLTGPIPSSLGNLGKLEYFHLFGNHLSGSIPA